MRTIVFCNPRSGRGRAAGVAGTCADALAGAGHQVDVVTLSADGAGPSLGSALSACAQAIDVVVIVGGDGTVHRALPHLLGHSAAVYQAPTGTENLFARQFGMDRSPGTLLAALERGRVEAVDVGVCNQAPFALMCSVGADAAIVHRVDARRARGGGAIRHWSYVRPIIDELFRPTLPRMTIEVDGRTIVDGRCGLAVVANSRQYAVRLDPARVASMTDGKLDVVFFPCEGGMGLARWVLASRLGSHERRAALVRACGERIVIEAAADGGAPCQMDGEAAGRIARLEVGVKVGALRVVVP